ncbi:hypothetical protein [Streptomyces sp. NPDC006879]|uniref:hypothetical protein n=1 Tax=Streptomyces sp. NPDC006879 TaxID=3364767 RepID=UPI0036817FEC
MLRYWLATARRLLLGAGASALVSGGAMAGVLIAEAPASWPGALAQGAAAGLSVGAALMLLIATSNTWRAARTAAHHGLALGAAAAPAHHRQMLRVPLVPGTTAYQLTDSVLHALKQVPNLRIEEVAEFTHGRLTLVYGSALGVPVRLSISIETGRDSATATVDARPTTTWKRLDGGASWSVLTLLAPHVRRGLEQHSGQ